MSDEPKKIEDIETTINIFDILDRDGWQKIRSAFDIEETLFEYCMLRKGLDDLIIDMIVKTVTQPMVDDQGNVIHDPPLIDKEGRYYCLRYHHDEDLGHTDVDKVLFRETRFSILRSKNRDVLDALLTVPWNIKEFDDEKRYYP